MVEEYFRIACLLIGGLALAFGLYHFVGTIIMWFRIRDREEYDNNTNNRLILKHLLYGEGGQFCSAMLAPLIVYKSFDEVKVVLSKFNRGSKYVIPKDGITFEPIVGKFYKDIFQSVGRKYIGIINKRPVTIKELIDNVKLILAIFNMWTVLTIMRSVAFSMVLIPSSVGAIVLTVTGRTHLGVVCLISEILICLTSYMFLTYTIDRKNRLTNDLLKERAFTITVNSNVLTASTFCKMNRSMLDEIKGGKEK